MADATKTGNGIAVIIVFVFLIAVGYFLYDRNEKKKQEEKLQALKDEATKIQESITADAEPVAMPVMPSKVQPISVGEQGQNELLTQAQTLLKATKDVELAKVLLVKINALQSAIKANDLMIIKAAMQDLRSIVYAAVIGRG